MKIGLGISPMFRGGGVDWSSYWATRNAYFALPAAGVSLMVGQEVTIYGDALINVPIGNPLVVTYTCDIGTQIGNNLVITPDAGDIGDHSLRAVFKNGSYTIEDKTIALTVYPKYAANFSILRIGDSTIYGEEIGTELETILDSCTITHLGTQGTTRKHEGYAGYQYKMFARNTDAPGYPSPFFKDGVLDIAAYFTDNSIAVPNFIDIRLGLNDVFTHCQLSGDGFSDAELTTILDDAKTLIDGFIAYNNTLKIIVSLPTTTENSGAGWDHDYDESLYSQDMYLEAIHKLQKGLADTFANGVYNARVDCSYEAIMLDRDEGYPKTDGVHTNALHFDASGRVQVADGLALKINEYLSEAFITTWETENAGSATKTINIPTYSTGYDCIIDWGDGIAETFIGGTLTTVTQIAHEYATTGVKKVCVWGTFPQIFFANAADKLKILTVEQWGSGVWRQMNKAFYGCANLTGNYTDTPDTSAVTTMSEMFHNCSLFNGAVNFDTAKVTTMAYMFANCFVFNKPVPFDTAKVTTMAYMFYECNAFNQELNFTTAEVTDMQYMLNKCVVFNQPLNFNTAKVTNMTYMIRTCSAFKQSLAGFNIGAVTTMTQIAGLTNINSTGTTNYDATLIAWAAQIVNSGLAPNFGTAKYSDAGGGKAARAILTGAPNSWSITDGGELV
jgi:hypothetical protein